jgi:predicted MPP superfamily phosphohydrolase
VGVVHLHPSLHGLKLAQLTDIHFNDHRLTVKGATDAVLQQAVEVIEREAVDLVVLTGDFVDFWPEEASTLADRWLSRLSSKHGTVAILGNHDYQKPESQRLVMEAFDRVGILTLVNQRAEPINEWLEVMGIGDFWKDYHPHRVMYPLSGLVDDPDPDTDAETESDADVSEESGRGQKAYRRTRVVLTHNPDSALHLNQWGADLMIAGHTHGGGPIKKVWRHINHLPYWIRRMIPGALALRHWHLSYAWIHVPRRGAIAPYERPTIPLYVCRGLDRLPRLMHSPPEVAVFTLLPASEHEQPIVREIALKEN